MPTTAEKIESLKGLTSPFVAELVKVEWGSPDGTIYYCATQLDEIRPEIITAIFDLYAEASPVFDVRLVTNSKSHELFQSVTIQHGIGDDEVPIKFSDIDGAMTTLFETHGEGIKVTLLYYFPDVDLLLEHFWGHLQQEDESDEEVFKTKVASGFRSAQLSTPRRRHNQECQAVFGGLLDSLAAVAQNDCPYNVHLIGGTIGNDDPLTSLPYTSCPRKTPADCIARLGPFPSPDLPTTGKRLNYLQMLSHTNIVGTLQNNQTSGPNLTVTSRGNQSNLKEPVRVVLGSRYLRNLNVLQYAPQENAANPNDGFVRVMFETCEGQISLTWGCRVNGTLIAAEHLQIRGGEVGQPPSTFANPVHNYSGTGHWYAVYGRVNPANYNAQNLTGECAVLGHGNIRVYTDATTYTEQFVRLRSWHLLEILCNKRWGYGLDYSRMDLAFWVSTLVPWDSQTVTFTDPDGGLWTSQRGFCDLDLVERSIQQQVSDICLSGRFSMPFLVNGKIRVAPMSALSAGELSACPIFSDEGDAPNIKRDEKTNKSTLKRKRKNPRDLINEVTVTFDEASNSDIEASITVRDDTQQLRAGRAYGDTTRRVVDKKQTLMGVRGRDLAIKLAFGILNLGTFDTGGLVNNLEIKFTTWFAYTLDLYPGKVIKVVSSSLTPYKEPNTEDSFTYFRIKEIKRQSNLEVEITAQAYPKNYMDDFETISTPPSFDNLEAEHEDNVLTGDCVVVADGELSNGEGVQLENGTLTYVDVEVEITGAWRILIYYKSSGAYSIPVTIRSNVYVVDFPDSDGDISSVEVLAGLSETTTNRVLFSAEASVTSLIIDRIALEFFQLDETGGCVLDFGVITYNAGVLSVPILPC